MLAEIIDEKLPEPSVDISEMLDVFDVLHQQRKAHLAAAADVADDAGSSDPSASSQKKTNNLPARLVEP